MGNGVLGVWGICAIRPTGGMGHMGNRGTGGMGYKGYRPHGQCDTWAMGYRDTGNGAHGQFAPKISKRCQVVKKMSSVKKSNT